MNNFWVFTDGTNFVNVGSLMKLTKVKSIDRASFWPNKKQALSWVNHIGKKFPKMQIKEAKLTIKE